MAVTSCRTHSSWRFVTGLRGDFTNGWSWDVSYNYVDWTDSQRDGGRAVQPRIEAMLDPDLCAADPLCDPSAGRRRSLGRVQSRHHDGLSSRLYGTVCGEHHRAFPHARIPGQLQRRLPRCV